MYKDKQLIVLTAGKSTRLFPLTFGMPKCLLSVKQKPSIYNMLIPMINNGLNDIIFVVNHENRQLITDFNNYVFCNLKLNINYISQDDFSGPGMALILTNKFIKKPTILLLGDTICDLPTNFDFSWIAVKNVSKKDTYKYCMVETNNQNEIIDLIDKPQDSHLNNAVIGMYYFKNPIFLKKSIEIAKSRKRENEFQLSTIFNEYMKLENIFILNVNKWIDIGNLEDYSNANKTLFNCRNFNKLETKDTILYKKSEYEKITSEYNWYKDVQGTLFEKYCPKFYDDCIEKDGYGVEYYDYLTLSEYKTFYPLSEYSNKYIFEQLINLMLKIYNATKKQDTNNYDSLLKSILVDKTLYRIEKWERTDLINSNIVNINDVDYLGFRKSFELLMPEIQKICSKSNQFISIIHGDPAYSNILFSPRTMIFKFIDPRGNFGIDTIFGDYRYDIAKLRHCYHGNYDDIINDLFQIYEDKGIKFSLYKSSSYEIYDKVLIERNINIDDIELIEALLFISMIPLHSDYPKRQLAFFANGLMMLNQQIKNRGIK